MFNKKLIIIINIVLMIQLINTSSDICYKQSYGRGVGVPLSKCKDGLVRDGALCYSPCDDGYTGAGPVCWYYLLYIIEIFLND
jgi:hypothetical protein